MKSEIMHRTGIRFWQCVVFVLLLVMAGAVAQGAPPVVKTVPWVASNPLIPHDTVSGAPHTLKGTADVQGGNFQYTWDFGDGSPVATGTVTDMYAIGAAHTYAGSVGDTYVATLNVVDTGTGESGSAIYIVAVRDDTLETRVNMAIDQGLWFLHTRQDRYSSGGMDYGRWPSVPAGSSYFGATAANVNAFEVNGHLEGGDPSNPYVETVARGLRQVFAYLGTEPISPQTYCNPDSNGNGYGVRVNQSLYPYQGGMFMDAIVASGTPGELTTTGPAPSSGSDPGIIGREYGDIVQDMVDSYAFGQYDFGSYRGGWRYSWNQGPDNSACQWAAIGILAAEREWGLTVPAFVKTENQLWLNASQCATGYFGYTSACYIPWGPYALTPSGMVQLAMVGVGRGNSSWDKAETYIRDRYCNAGNWSTAIRSYYYGLFSFTKSMLLHDSNADGVAEPLILLQSQTAGVNPIDWYGAQAADGAPCDGVARTLVNDQAAGGYWYAHNRDGRQYPFETAWAIIMLNRTVFASGVPVAVATAVPNPAVAAQVIDLSGAASFHQDPDKSVDSWDWDLDNDGDYDDASGVTATVSFPAVGSHPVSLRVTDDGDPELSDDTTLMVVVDTPPLAPTADADGPYVFCPQTQPWFLDGTGSVNPDEGGSEPGAPGDTIIEYAWDMDGDGQFDDAFGSLPDVTAFFTALGTGDYLIQLRVTDNTSQSYPSSGLPDLSDTANGQASVRAASDPQCSCVDDLAARAKDGKVQLTWTDIGAPGGYNVYRSTTQGGPYAFLGNTTSTYSVYMDYSVVNGVTYYYVVRAVALNTNELCQSNEASATPRPRRRR